MRLIALLTCLLLPALSHAADPSLEITNAYAHPPIGAGKVGIAFMTLENKDDQTVSLIGAKSDAFGYVSLHTHRNFKGVMHMQSIDSIEVPAGESVELKSGGLHLMLMEPKRNIAEGDTLKMTFTVSDETSGKTSEQTLSVPVKARQ